MFRPGARPIGALAGRPPMRHNPTSRWGSRWSRAAFWRVAGFWRASSVRRRPRRDPSGSASPRTKGPPQASKTATVRVGCEPEAHGAPPSTHMYRLRLPSRSRARPGWDAQERLWLLDSVGSVQVLRGQRNGTTDASRLAHGRQDGGPPVSVLQRVLVGRASLGNGLRVHRPRRLMPTRSPAWIPPRDLG